MNAVIRICWKIIKTDRTTIFNIKLGSSDIKEIIVNSAYENLIRSLILHLQTSKQLDISIIHEMLFPKSLGIFLYFGSRTL